MASFGNQSLAKTMACQILGMINFGNQPITPDETDQNISISDVDGHRSHVLVHTWSRKQLDLVFDLVAD